ncbi:MAG: heat-shock protein [Pseudomonadales bacterium]|nr:RNA-binding protein [Pseudomonadales bacterium]MCP5329396.1 heat-shock protein [Pseudomonadales bacterium]MCP5344686.1 heat-shock protein [Pseudomonadales bacterium]
MSREQHKDKPVRLDKWLWAARLYKTRAIAKQAVESGKVHSDGQRLKPGREVNEGMELTVRQGWDERTLLVTGLSEQRRGASEAALLYQETGESIARREQLGEQRRLHALLQQPLGRPDKKDRRLRQQLKQQTE